MSLALIITAGFALLAYTSRLAETQRAARTRTHERARMARTSDKI
jgi:hypothetical protein